MNEFAPPLWITASFVAVVLAVLGAWGVLILHAAPPNKRVRWLASFGALAAGWILLHLALTAFVARPNVVVRVMPVLLVTMACAVWLAFSPLGTRLAKLPAAWLVGVHAFRLPLELVLHALFDSGNLPEQMTWSGYNFDVVAGVSAIGCAYLLAKRPRPALAFAWNLLGSVLLLAVTAIAVLSLPLPIRQFDEGPALMLPFSAPYNLIVSVLVWSALAWHLILWRKLRTEYVESKL